MKNILLPLFILFYAQTAHSSAKEAYKAFSTNHTKDRDKVIARELIDGGYYFSAIPFINTYLENNNEMDKALEEDIETLVLKTGTMAVLNIDEKRLANFKTPAVALVLGTRQFNKEKYADAYRTLEGIPENHIFTIEASLIRGTIKNLERKHIEAKRHYDLCITKAENQEERSKGEKLKRYYNYLKETCIIRTARLSIEDKKYEEALAIYKKIDKTSYKWPYILMDKAWANYYLNDFNRTLGLTVTYKSPLLESYFFPEAEVLMALSYYNLCLWDDSMKVVDNFYDSYRSKALALKEILGKNRASHTYFLDLYYADSQTREDLNPFIRNLITQTRKQVKFNLDLASLKASKSELVKLKTLKHQNEFTKVLEQNLQATTAYIGAKINYYIKKEIFTFINEIHKHSYSMFNLKLELLSKKRQDVYSSTLKTEASRSRGSDHNITRTTDQYFFDFNGSFWADELGDYSFGLASNCKAEGK